MSFGSYLDSIDVLKNLQQEVLDKRELLTIEACINALREAWDEEEAAFCEHYGLKLADAQKDVPYDVLQEYKDKKRKGELQ